MNINLGPPYEVIIERIIEKGLAGNQTEVIRQALLAYERFIEEEEVKLVDKAINAEMNEVNVGTVKLRSFKDYKAKNS